MERLRRYPWPGNVGELRAVIRRALLLCDGAKISTGDLTVDMPTPLAKPGGERDGVGKPIPALTLLCRDAKPTDEVERQPILEALKHSPPALVKAFTLRGADSSKEIAETTARVRDVLTRGHTCRIVIRVDDGKTAQPAACSIGRRGLLPTSQTSGSRILLQESG